MKYGGMEVKLQDGDSQLHALAAYTHLPIG
jgi:hypothetical protein